ncbi:flavin reductase [Lampropedia cohaerens]|uniref:Flavin reductase n=1 Tax=Lampropedia cohaerens TaxID=1610491 RepID=A0A0U1PZY0_9BURK|nr:flavin reductase family protein [Lampropedia cohaerens]KKW68050.1 flavin reductase [Lampropedia cohaerens]
MSHTTKELREAFGTFMTGVTVATTHVQEIGPIGFTANSFSSVSLEPALLQISIAKSSRNHTSFINASHFAINVLAEDQVDISNTFARPGENRFANVAWHFSDCGSPLLEGVSAWFDCAMHAVIDAGDHSILIGRVENFHSAGPAGLGYYRGGYFTPNKMFTEVKTAPETIISAIIGHAGKVLLIPASNGRWTLPAMATDLAGTDKAITRLFNQFQPDASANFVYSVYTDSEKRCQHITFLCSSPVSEPLAGQYVSLDDLHTLNFEDVAVLRMLERYRREDELKNYGLYYGNNSAGVIRELFKKAG